VDSEDKENTEIQGAGVHAVQPLRTLARVPQKVWRVQDLFQGAVAQRADSGRGEGELVSKAGGNLDTRETKT
jgi:hypothetical protein